MYKRQQLAFDGYLKMVSDYESSKDVLLPDLSEGQQCTPVSLLGNCLLYTSKITVVRRGKVRRSKLFYLRGLSGKAARIKEIR